MVVQIHRAEANEQEIEDRHDAETGQVESVDERQQRVHDVEAGNRAEDVRALSVKALHDGQPDELVETDGPRGRRAHGEVGQEPVGRDVPGGRRRVDVVEAEPEEVRAGEYPGESLGNPALPFGKQVERENYRFSNEEERRVGEPADEVERLAGVDLQPLVRSEDALRGMDPEVAQIERVRLADVDDRRADEVLVPAHRIVDERPEQERIDDASDPAAFVGPEGEPEQEDDERDVLRPEPSERLHRQKEDEGEQRHADAEEGMRAPSRKGAVPQSQRFHSPCASRRGSAGRAAGAGVGATRGASGARSVRRRSPKASRAGSAKSAGEKQVSSPITAVRPKDWMAMLSAVTRVA